MQTVANAQSGQWYDGMITREIDIDDKSALNEDVTAMKIGYPIIVGTDPNTQAKKPTATFTFAQFLGIIYKAEGLSEKALYTGALDIITNQRFSYLRKGYIAVLVTSTAGLSIVKGTNVWAVFAAGGDSTQWTFRNSLDTDKAAKIPAIFTKSTTIAAASSAIVEIKLNADMSIGVS